jgi:microcin C transport system permease protein
MIEKLFKTELGKKRWRRFKRRKAALFSSVAVGIMLVLTLIAPLISNNKPFYLSYNNKSYYPIFFTYSPKEFGIEDSFIVEYKKLELSDSDTAIWPLVRWSPFESNDEVDEYPSPPSDLNPMGTDESGRDVFARILYGFKYSMGYALFAWLFSMILGIIFGGIMGFFGGKTDLIGQRIVEILSTTPQFFLLLILISIFTPNLWLLIAITSIFGWISISYYVRGEFLKNRKREFVEAAKAMGATNSTIIFKHILPNSLTPVITFAPFVISGHIIGLASLDYLGFGLPVPTPSWGELLAQAQKHFTVAWWLAVYPAVALFTTLTLLNLIGEGIRDALDPNMT